MKSKKLILFGFFLAFLYVMIGCQKDNNGPKDATLPTLNAQVRVQVAYDDTHAAFRFVWKSQSKTLPAGYANTGKKYPGHFHDMLVHDGEKFDRFASDARMQEDRVSFMIDKVTDGIQGFAKASCAMTCHTGMASHNFNTPDIVDHWHWRGGRSGPMGYAEDAAVGDEQRLRDPAGTPPTKFIRSGGDRFREDQAALSGTAHGVLSDGLPRFVFNKGKTIGEYTIPAYFIADMNDNIVTDPFTVLPGVTDVTTNRSLLVVYQDLSFDSEDKVNALDLGYLVYVATSEVDHLPEHLKDTNSADFTTWSAFWAGETGIGVADAAQALAKLNEVHQEWVGANKLAMVTRSVAFIYQSDQHDISSEHAYNSDNNEWEVVLYRRLNTSSQFDVNLADLGSGAKYALGFAMHDVGGAAISHNISITYLLGNTEDADIVAGKVEDVTTANWNAVPYFDTYYVKPTLLNKWTAEWLTGPSHGGSAMIGTSTCLSCHQNNLYSGVLN
ncbi:MAG: hypothetical protein K0B37_00245 [Bacteroidales bacterium]|nr:hypothetical protein [Bacteroidales bacterium]